MNFQSTKRSAKGHKGCLTALLLFVLVVATVLAVNWDTWFGDLPEEHFVLSAQPERVYLLPGEDGVTERTITWVSGDSIGLSLEIQGAKHGQFFHRTPKVTKVATGGGVTYVYGTRLSGLSEDEIFTYRIKDASRTTLFESSFVVRSKEAQALRFAYIGDIQDREPTGTDDFIREVTEVIPEADAWLFGGDQIERPHNKFWSLFYRDVSSVAGKIPFIPAAGNHEYRMGLNFDLDDRWPFIFEMPDNGPRTPEGASYFVDYPFARIIVLDTNVYAWFFPRMNDWLRTVLSDRKDDPFLIVMGHHPVFSVRKWRNNYTVDYALQPLMEEMGVDLYLSGHDHAYSRNELGGVVHIVSSSSDKTYPVGDPSKHRVSRSGERYFVGLEVKRDTLALRSFVQGDALPFDSIFITHKDRHTNL